MADNSTSLIRNPGKAGSPTVRGSEGAGTTVLSRTDSFWQIFNLSAARTVLLPSVGVKAGDQIRLDLRSLFTLTVQAANASQIAAMSSLGSGTWVALIDSPAASTDWLYAGGTSPAAMDDATATRLGLKVYSHGTTYTGSPNSPTVTLGAGGGSISSVVLSSFIPYQVQSGAWRMKFTIVLTVDVLNRANLPVIIAGIVYANTYQFGVGGTTDAQAFAVYTEPSNSQLQIVGTVTAGFYSMSFDVLLASKPTWAY